MIRQEKPLDTNEHQITRGYHQGNDDALEGTRNRPRSTDSYASSEDDMLVEHEGEESVNGDDDDDNNSRTKILYPVHYRTQEVNDFSKNQIADWPEKSTTKKMPIDSCVHVH